MNLYKTESNNITGRKDLDIKNYTPISYDKVNSIYEGFRGGFDKELQEEGYLYIRGFYIIDIDYKGNYETFHKYFNNICSEIKKCVREERLDKLGI